MNSSKPYSALVKIFKKYIEKNSGRVLLNMPVNKLNTILEKEGIGYQNFYAHMGERKRDIEIIILAFEHGQVLSGKLDKLPPTERSGMSSFGELYKILDKYIIVGNGKILLSMNNRKFEEELRSKGIGDDKFFAFVSERKSVIDVAAMAFESGRENTEQTYINDKYENISGASNKMTQTNTILYGPPGTGKTYHTVDYALRIIDPGYYDENRHDRTQLKQRFDELVELGRIGFVTFHQSFGYEDFVEGIRADADDDGAISYSVQDGIFKELCERAITDDERLGIDAAVVKLIEYLEDNSLVLETATGKRFSVTYRGGRTFRIHPQESSNSEVYRASINNVKKAYRGMSKKDIYNPSYVYSILEHLKSEYHLGEERVSQQEEPVVLVIDEINRGNTANIFGELITLIEPSKRAGADEALEVMLPYSKEKFSVPNNLYIIGTMNTADRSLALLDTALRRRFKFVEMTPDPQLLDGISIDGIDVRLMFETINKRISILYDREHMIGHSFFLPLKENGSFESLREIFENDILPLLEEYFFEDWEKIGRALGDNGKPQHLKMIQPTMTEQEMEALLGDEDNGINSIQYQRNDGALNNPQAYISIYQTV